MRLNIDLPPMDRGGLIAGFVIALMLIGWVALIPVGYRLAQEQAAQDAIDEINKMARATEQRRRAQEAARQRAEAALPKPKPFVMPNTKPAKPEIGPEILTPNAAQKKQATRRPLNGELP